MPNVYISLSPLGAEESFNETKQLFVDMEITILMKYDLEDSENDFIIYYNNRKHITTEIDSYRIIRNANDE